MKFLSRKTLEIFMMNATKITFFLTCNCFRIVCFVVVIIRIVIVAGFVLKWDYYYNTVSK